MEDVKPTDVTQLDNKLVQAVKCRRPDGSEYLVLHPVEIDYSNQLYGYGNKESEVIELQKGSQP